MSRASESAAVLATEALHVAFLRSGRTIAAVREVSLAVGSGECVGIVGESGAGKTQLFMATMGLLPKNARVSGSVRFEDREILGLSRDALNRVRGAKLAMIFQDPMVSLAPHLSIGVQLAEVLVCHRDASWRDAERAALGILERVGLSEPKRRLRQYPHELSGGMRQRVMIGMSLLCEPLLLIADEPTSALDVTVQAQIIDLLRSLRGESGMAIALISHDLGVVAGLADRIVVMYAGRIVESAPAGGLLRHARHPYSALLVRCIPDVHRARLGPMPYIPGQTPGPDEVEIGCAFAPRCPHATDRCRAERPRLEDLGGEVHVACHYPL
ncbi:MAG TPA: ABC transporter ATP-binding protein [Steroidobacteraceae bacterium]|nr:ABC transporter ATP-binding protein [Steroidobacteraceae bacterium]